MAKWTYINKILEQLGLIVVVGVRVWRKKKMKQIVLLLGTLLLVWCARDAAGHGMLVDPPNRSSLWRFDASFPVNWDDNQNYCGGFNVSTEKCKNIEKNMK